MALTSSVGTPRTFSGTGSSSGPANSLTVIVQSVDGTVAHVRDQLGQTRQISTTRMFGKGVAPPAKGETWLATNMFGGWIFAVQINPDFSQIILRDEVEADLATINTEITNLTALPNISDLTTVTDWNSATSAGYYLGSSAANGPAVHTYLGDVIVSGSTILQTLYRVSTSTGDFSIWQRIYSPSAWTAWKAVATPDTPWTSYTPTLTNASTGATISSTGGTGKYLVEGKKCTAWGQLTSNAATSGGAAVDLPFTAHDRLLTCGTLWPAPSVTTGGPPTGMAYMTSDKARLVVTNISNSFLDVPTSTTIRWSVTYELP